MSEREFFNILLVSWFVLAAVIFVALFYIVANILLATHLYHGVWSMFQTLGVNHPRCTPWLKGGAKVFGVVIGLGNCSIPLAVLAGLLSQRA